MIPLHSPTLGPVKHPWLRRLALRHKIWLALTALTLTLLAVFISLLRWGLHRNLGDYVAEIELGRMNGFAHQLEQTYATRGNWDFLHQDADVWYRLQRPPPLDGVGEPNSLRFSLPQPDGADGARNRPPPPPDWGQRPPPPPEDLDFHPQDSIYERLALLDAQGETRIAGSPRAETSTIRRPLTQGIRVIGYLAMTPLDASSTAAGRNFLAEQVLFVLEICGTGYLLALLLTWALAEHWIKPIRHLSAGADAIAQGKLTTQIPVAGNDELSQLAVTFNTMAQQLHKAEESHQHWLSDIAHELRTPLAAMRAEIEATMDGVRPLNPTTMQQLHKQILRLGQLVEDLRRSMDDAESRVPHTPDVQPLEVLLETLHMKQAQFAQARLTVNATSAQTLAQRTNITMTGSAAQLQQVFANVLENTLRYTNPGGQVRLTATLVRNQSQLCIRIDDSPPAPAVTDMPRLFERLYRGEGSRDRAFGGSGLGLAICKHIIETHGGSIRADDSELGGLCIELLLPVKCDDGNAP